MVTKVSISPFFSGIEKMERKDRRCLEAMNIRPHIKTTLKYGGKPPTIRNIFASILQ
jgi:hypothetical protein